MAPRRARSNRSHKNGDKRVPKRLNVPRGTMPRPLTALVHWPSDSCEDGITYGTLLVLTRKYEVWKGVIMRDAQNKISARKGKRIERLSYLAKVYPKPLEAARQWREMMKRKEETDRLVAEKSKLKREVKHWEMLGDYHLEMLTGK
jgi:hypothetical protein